MANPGDFAYTVKQQADIVRIVGDYVKLRKAGAQNYAGLCPFHTASIGLVAHATSVPPAFSAAVFSASTAIAVCSHGS